jgi:5-methylthioadenosine/S-adenosylhomocysteine deaminase
MEGNMVDLLIQNTTVIDPSDTGLDVLYGYDVAITGQHIVDVQPTGKWGADAARERIDGGELVTLPGLINSHAHSAMTLFRGSAEDVPIDVWFNDYIWAMESHLTPEDIYWGTLLAAVESIESGVTTIADHYFGTDQVAEAFAASGLRGELAWTMFGQDPSIELNAAGEFAARWHGAAEGRIRTWFGPHAPYTCPAPFLREVASEAQRLGLRCHIHVSETAEQVRASIGQHGVTPIRLLEQVGLMNGPLLCAHATHATPEDVKLLAEHNVGVAHCPKTFLKLAEGIAPITAMLEAGVPVGLGSDGAASNNTLDILEQTRLTALMQKHTQQDARKLPAGLALSLSSLGGARALGRAEELGRLATGFLADVTLVRLDGAHMQPLHDLVAALVYSARASDVDTVVVNGRVLMRQRQLLTLDKPTIVREVAARAKRLRESGDEQRIHRYGG